VFDGNGHTISNFTYTCQGDDVGLFGCIGSFWEKGEIKDLGLINPNVDAGTGWSVGSLVGDMDDGTITRCYSEGGSVSGDQIIGGLVGEDTSVFDIGIGTFSNSFWDVETSGQLTSSGGTGKTTAEMQIRSTFTNAGWDFVDETANGTEDVWWILEGQDYPRLWWEPLSY